MAVTPVLLILDLYDGAQNLVTSGKAVLQPSVPVADTVNHQAVVAPVTASFSDENNAVPLQLFLRACDDPDLTPAGWQWTISFPGVPGSPAGFSFFLDSANGSVQYCSSQVPVQAVAPVSAYLPLPSGFPSAGQVPVATGSGQASAWGAGSGGGGGSGTVTSVTIESANGLAGTVAGSTAAAQVTLKTTVTGLLKGN